MWFEGGSEEDQAYLAQFEIWGKVPLSPIRLPGLGRYGRLSFDSELLMSPCDLSVSQKKEWLFLADHFHKIDHLEFFDLQVDSVQMRDLKKAYFVFSKKYHPDALGSLNLGMYHQHGSLIFDYGRTVYELLNQDLRFFETYVRVVQERNLTFRQHLEKERQRQHKSIEKRQKRAKKPVPPNSPIFLSRHIENLRKLKPTTEQDPSPSLNLGATPESELRKEQIRERLAQNQNRIEKNRKKSRVEKISDQVSSFYHAGQQAEDRKQWVRALNHYKLCMKYQPHEIKYQEAVQRIEEQAQIQHALQLWQKAVDFDQLEMEEKSLPLYKQSLETHLIEIHLIDWIKRLGDRNLEDQCHWLKKGIEQWPNHIQIKWMMANVQDKMGQVEQATLLCKEILSLDPTEPRSLKLLKKYGVQ